MSTALKTKTKWIKFLKEEEFPEDLGVCIKHDELQIAVFNFKSMNQWYAAENRCPHNKEMVIGRGILGDASGRPKITCAMHKRSFSLNTGKCLNDESVEDIQIFEVKVEDGYVYIKLPE
ncbi:MAG: nitrite reductase small subunit NirD [Spirochaetia bacterium]|nr:nitrite reductase small subunit NirD [Spirochaetia bacterium]